MINTVPSSWDYDESLESLFLFYQVSEELLSFYSPDTYRVSVHNAYTLCFELEQIYTILSESNQLTEYYSKYCAHIIDELLFAITQDSILKSKLGKRRESVVTGLAMAKDNSTLLMRWINQILQSCSFREYVELCKNRITMCITENKDKDILLFYTNSFYVSLLNNGYSVEYLYQQLKLYFDGKSKRINNVEQISTFLDKFSFMKTDIELYIVADTYLIESFSRINPEFQSVVTKIDEETIRKDATMSQSLNLFLDNYHRLCNRENVGIISYKTKAVDPFSALRTCEFYFDLVQTFEGYFKHKVSQKICFDVVQHVGSRYYPIKLRKKVPNRPYLEQKLIDQRSRAIIECHSTSRETFKAIISALGTHFEAINCRNAGMMLRTFWTATETLFFNDFEHGGRENVVYSLHRIIEKTYLLKMFRMVYGQLTDAITNDSLSELGIVDFQSFIVYFSTDKVSSAHYKRLTGLLADNPLLRYRLYTLRKELDDSKHIRDKLEQHNKKIQWQILRIYRTRNLSTHAGINMAYIDDILFNIHNYFDYVVNFIICKIENNEYVPSITAVVFEAKNDNSIHMEYLKKQQNLDENNCFELLFGPDKSMVEYEFETSFENEEKED